MIMLEEIVLTQRVFNVNNIKTDAISIIPADVERTDIVATYNGSVSKVSQSNQAWELTLPVLEQVKTIFILTILCVAQT
jgi:hypothetical protein